MRPAGNRRTKRAVASWMAALVALGTAGCGGEDFENKPGPPVPEELTGVIQSSRVTISPDRIGAGPILITISNQTTNAHTITLEGRPRRGERVRERVGPINPLDTAMIQKTLRPGSYEVRAGSAAPPTRQLLPARLSVGRPRADSSDRLLLP